MRFLLPSPAALICLLLLGTPARAGDADGKVLALLAEDLEESMRTHPTWASERGDRRFDDLLDDESPEAIRDRVEHARLRLEALGAIDRAALSPAVRTHAALLEHVLRERISYAAFHPEQTPVTQLGGPQRDLPELPSQLSFTTDEHFADYIARLEKVPLLLEQVTTNMRAGLAAGRTPPRVTLAQAAEQALVNGTEAQAADPTLHPMYPPFLVADHPLAPRAKEAIAKRVVPAFKEFGEFLRHRYIPACRASIGASESVDGIAWYRAQLRHHTTLDLSPDEIHELGLKEVARIRAGMAVVIERTGFEGDFKAFTDHLRTDRRFYYTDAEDLLAGYRAIAKRIDAEMPRFFGRLPRLPYGVKEMPAFIAPASPTAYYYRGSMENGVPGYFVANTFLLDQRPKYEMVPLTLHEAVPGHHHQIALSQEMEGMPEWRTTLSFTAFVEGWGLYAERLGLEMGLYEDPHDDFGRLSYEMWRAMRLVVDTGIHAKGWTRDRAVEFMLQNSALTRQNVEREVDRYIAWPGQACAYKIGELKIRELRAAAERELGAKFDLRAFHDMILGEGAIPLPLLEARAKAWIKAR
jgi:prolyl oligopeptidase